jgi:hypothetical protein
MIQNCYHKDQNFSLKGHARIDIYKGDVQSPETFIESYEYDNVIVTNGKGLLLDRLFGIGGTAINSMGIGNSAQGASSSDTQLLGSAPAPFLQALDTVPPTRAGLVVTCISTFGTGVANQTWQECGLFNGTTNGTSVMLDRIAPIGPFTKTNVVSIVLTITITQS